MKLPDQKIDVIYEDNHLLVINKPAGIATMGTGDDRVTLLDVAKQYIKQKYDKPGNVYLGVVSRLDAVTSGVIVFARTSKAADRLSRLFHDRKVDKRYLALVEGLPQPSSRVIESFLIKDDSQKRMVGHQREIAGSKLARLSYTTIASRAERALLSVELETGRKHQIREQLASIGHAVVGDRKYGSDVSFPGGVALHAYRLAFLHPVGNDALEFTAPLPGVWPRWCHDAVKT